MPTPKRKLTKSRAKKSSAGSASARKRKSTAKKRGKKTGKKKSLNRRLLKWGAALVALGVLALFALFGAVYIGLFGALPSEEDLRNIHNANAAEIYSSDGKLLGTYHIQNRSSVEFTEIPQTVVDALISTEDSRYFEHEGIDFYSIPRVVIRTILLGDRSAGGGSTISQQLVKNVFGRQRHGLLSIPVNKLKENITALKLEDTYSKQEIIALYLNTVSFGENVYGIKAAGRRFFNKDLDDLEVQEIATLIGMLKANTTYNPRLYPEASMERRNVVLALMAQNGHIDVAELIELQSKPLGLDYRNLQGRDGSAPYLRAFLRNRVEELLADTDRGDGSPYDLLSDGLRITLTINAHMQEKTETVVKKRMAEIQKTFDAHWEGRRPAGLNEDFLWAEARKTPRYKAMQAAGSDQASLEKAFTTPGETVVFSPDGPRKMTLSPLDSIAYHQMILQAGFLAVESETGKVLAYVGGTDHAFFPHDHVHAKRQVGSTFKPFVYATALEYGFQPCDYVENERIIFSNYEDWSPENADGTYGGWYTLKGGLAKSANVVAARLIAETGPEPVREMARRNGIQNLPKGPAIALGVADIALEDMVHAYIPFATSGVASSLQYVLRIETPDGKVLFDLDEDVENRRKRVMDREIADTMREMLRTVVDSGTARSLRTTFGVRTPMGGKTGTTQNNADGWFISFTPKVVCGAWVGAESPAVRFRSTALGQGAATALPLVADWVRACETDSKTASLLGKKFAPVDEDIVRDLDCPLHVDSRVESFFDRLFNRDAEPREKRIGTDGTEDEDEDSDRKEGGWIKRLFNKLKKN